jgi:serine/threonine protein kinase
MAEQVNTGTVLAGKYRLEMLIGRGGMGSVWRAEHLGLNAPVAVKLLDLVDFTGTTEALSRFHREARAAAAIRSPHVVQILDHGFDEAIVAPFIVMELMEGESLAQRLARVGRISPNEVARVLTQVARALGRAHEAGIVHRDLKPDNVFLVRNDDEEVAKVLDFGIAKAHAHGLGNDSATRTGAVMGTAYYMSPEQISGTKNLDFRTDLWAFGVMACECLTGVRPFDAETVGGLTLRICIEPIPLPSKFASVPAGFDAWFMRIVNRDPMQRFSSAREAADALRQVCTGEAVSRHPSSSGAQANVPVSASTATTGAPLSRAASNLSTIQIPKQKSIAPVLIGVAVVAVAVAAAVLLWVRAHASHGAEAAAASAGLAPTIAAAAPETTGAVPNFGIAAVTREPAPEVAPAISAPPPGAANASQKATAEVGAPNARASRRQVSLPTPRVKDPTPTATQPAAGHDAPKPPTSATSSRDLLDNR